MITDREDREKLISMDFPYTVGKYHVKRRRDLEFLFVSLKLGRSTGMVGKKKHVSNEDR